MLHTPVYKIKDTNTAIFTVPPTFEELMYDRGVLARAIGGKIEVVQK